MSRRATLTGSVLLGLLLGLGALIWFDINHEGWRSWLKAQPVLSVVTLVVGFVVLGWQLRRQHENTRAVNRQQSRDRLKLDIYNEIARRIEATSAPIAEAGTTPTAVVEEFRIRTQSQMSSRHTPVSLRALGVEAGRAILGLMAVLETYEIVMPEFVAFRRELAERHAKLGDDLSAFITYALPYVAVADNGTPLRWPPDDTAMEWMSFHAGFATRTSLELVGVITDLRIEAQNYLLGELFERPLPKRAPSDPSIKVVSIESRPAQTG